MENSHEESPLSAVEDFSPQPSPSPADFSDSDRDEREKERILLDVKLIYTPECRMSHQTLKMFSRKCLTKIKLIKTAKLLFGHCWAMHCHIGKDKSNTYLIKKTKNHFHFMGTSTKKGKYRSATNTTFFQEKTKTKLEINDNKNSKINMTPVLQLANVVYISK